MNLLQDRQGVGTNSIVRNNTYYIYFKDVRSNIKYASVLNVGLFLCVKHFGKVVILYITNQL